MAGLLRGARPKLDTTHEPASRATLALAIAERDASAARHAALSDARSGLWEARHDAARRVETAREALANGRKAWAAHAFATALGEAAAAPPSLETLRAEYQAAQDAEQIAEAAPDQADAELGRLGDASAGLAEAVKKAAVAVVLESASFAGLVERVERLQRALVAEAGLLQWAVSNDAVQMRPLLYQHEYTPEERTLYRVQHALSQPVSSWPVIHNRLFSGDDKPTAIWDGLSFDPKQVWAAAFEALLADANAALPEGAQ